MANKNNINTVNELPYFNMQEPQKYYPTYWIAQLLRFTNRIIIIYNLYGFYVFNDTRLRNWSLFLLCTWKKIRHKKYRLEKVELQIDFGTLLLLIRLDIFKIKLYILAHNS